MTKQRQVAIITGASSGVGWATALRLAREGYDLCLTARNEPALNRLARDVRNLGVRCVVVAGDVTKMDDVQRIVDVCIRDLGRIDVLVNNAAIQAYSFFEDYSWEEIEHVNDVNYFGYLRFARAALPQMRAQKSGVIVNVLSVLDQAGMQYFTAYSASKHALLGWAKCLMLELTGTGIDITNVVLPSLNRPIYDHSLNRMGSLPKPPPPIYDVEVGAKAITQAIANPQIKKVPVFIQGTLALWLDYAIPSFGKTLMSLFGLKLQKRKGRAPATDGNFWQSVPEKGGAYGTLPSTAAWKRYLPLAVVLALSVGGALRLGKINRFQASSTANKAA